MIEIPFSPAVILTGAVIAQGFFASLLLLLQRRNQKANRYLGILVFFFSLWLCDTFFRVSRIYQQDPDFYFLPIYYSFAFGPLLYFYTKSITESNFVLKTHHWVHFVPVFFQSGLYVFLQFQDYTYRRWFWLEVHQPLTYNLEFNFSLISLLIYLFLSIKLIMSYQKWIMNHYSEISKINLNWLKIAQSVLLIISVFWLADVFLREVWQYYPDQPLSAIAMGFAILALAIGGLFQAKLGNKGINTMEIKSESLNKNETVDEAVLMKIKENMEKGEYYLNPDLTLEVFAGHLQLPPRLVSFQINKGLGIPFIDFVNGYRVEAVKQHLEADDLAHLTLLGIALESGFNAKSTFNRVFKKVTGKSPSAYQKEVQNRP